MTDELLSKYGIAGRFTWEMKAEQMGKREWIELKFFTD